jgi:thioredoxin reductase
MQRNKDFLGFVEEMRKKGLTDKEIVDGLNLNSREAGYIKAGEDGVTSVPGVFAAGDVRTKQLRQIITAAADGANCVTSVEKYLISH